MWKLDGTQAALDSAELIARLDLAQPHAGIKIALFDAGQESTSTRAARSNPLDRESLDGDFLCIHLPDSHSKEEIVDCWMRGDDAVAVYAATARRAVRPEIYWRRLATNSPSAAGLELIVSVQTGLLDAPASVRVSTRLQSAELMWVQSVDDPANARRLAPGDQSPQMDRLNGSSVFVFRPASRTGNGAEFSYVQMVFPSDFSTASVQWTPSQETILNCELFPESLEKGVIRRARIRGFFVPRANDLAIAADLYNEFSASPLPLTT